MPRLRCRAPHQPQASGRWVARGAPALAAGAAEGSAARSRQWPATCCRWVRVHVHVFACVCVNMRVCGRSGWGGGRLHPCTSLLSWDRAALGRTHLTSHLTSLTACPSPPRCRQGYRAVAEAAMTGRASPMETLSEVRVRWPAVLHSPPGAHRPDACGWCACSKGACWCNWPPTQRGAP